MGLRGTVFAVAVLLAGYASAEESVVWGNDGSIHGAHRITVTPDERAVVHTRRGGGDVNGDVILTLADGSFEGLQVLARDVIADLNATVETPEHICMDAGVDFIERRMDESVTQFDGSGCPDPAVQAAMAALNDFVRQATVE